MNGGNGAEYIPLEFAILDGPDLNAWPVFGKKFPELVQDIAKIKPYAVSKKSLQHYSVKVQPIWCGPEDLLTEKRLGQVAGVIVDAMPKNGLEADLEEKKDTLRQHLIKIKKKYEKDDQVPFKRFGYSVWFVTDDASRLARFRNGFNDVTNIINGANFQYFTEERIFMAHLGAYLSNIYNVLDRGR